MGLSDLFRAIFSLFGRAPAAAQPPSISPSSASTAAQQPATAAPAPAVVPVVPVPVAPPPAAAPADISTPAGFIAAIAPAAQACAKRTGVPASVTVAQAALESSWGRRAPGMNLFGIKADASWRGPVTPQVTHEVVNGETITITARFRAYDTWQGSIDDHAAFLTGNPRYRPAFAFKDGPSFARAIAKAGYATDPLYADKLIAVMSTRGLGALDHPEA
ncbi:glycoside hydrolase family 73 protein [Burkholderia cepacia]|uniref:glycoside hydrolase family 73 protein n=1 Tax=Burkholderia cepacia TaxID=292 RepID=UPI0009BDAC81|nr:glucosaminidase domain-containing protein [Burkholderia cepacia]